MFNINLSFNFIKGGGFLLNRSCSQDFYVLLFSFANKFRNFNRQREKSRDIQQKREETILLQSFQDTDTVPVNKMHLTGTVSVNKAYLTDQVPVKKMHLTDSVTANKMQLIGTLALNMMHVTGTIHVNKVHLTETGYLDKKYIKGTIYHRNDISVGHAVCQNSGNQVAMLLVDK